MKEDGGPIEKAKSLQFSSNKRLKRINSVDLSKNEELNLLIFNQGEKPGTEANRKHSKNSYSVQGSAQMHERVQDQEKKIHKMNKIIQLRHLQIETFFDELLKYIELNHLNIYVRGNLESKLKMLEDISSNHDNLTKANFLLQKVNTDLQTQSQELQLKVQFFNQ